MSSWRAADAADLGFVGGELLSDAALRHRLSAARGRAARWVRRIRPRLVMTDAAVVLASIAIATTLGMLLEPANEPFAREARLSVAAVTAVSWLAFIAAAHTRDERVLGLGVREYRLIANSTLLEFGFLALVIVVIGVQATRTFVLVALPLGLVGLLCERWLWRKWLLRQRRCGEYLAPAIVVGSAADADYVVRKIGEREGIGYRVVGVALDDEPTPLITAHGETVPIVSNLADIATRARELEVEAVIIAGRTPGDGEFIRELSWQLEGTGAELVLSSRLTDVAGPRIHFQPIDGLPLIQVEIPRFEGGKHALKRGFDIAASGLGLLAITPLLIGIAIAIRLDGRGPVFYTQARVGRDGRRFRMVKFRSMVPDADRRVDELAAQNDGAGVLFKVKDDPRVTRVGRFLRRHSLDELPQLWNVLRGDMSMVGPRPPLEAEVVEYAGHVHRRLLIKPGLTGLWQVSGRSDLDWDESVRLDLYYVENWSITGDLMLIWRTVRVVLHPVGAY